ncbi:DUF2207 domain-containing protein [Actinocorallia sp. B10E7]|uniref:DUF2207 domain-containing protein n=1 Tax=Actinocorallia sp. B10E7 TaxID=3153558 RepID=UPI00325EC21B
MTLCALLLLALLPFLLGGRNTPEGSVPAYDVVLTVRPDGTVHVREAFTFDYARPQTHGLVRGVRERDGDRVYRMRGLTVTSTTNAPVDVQVEEFLHDLHIVIGEGRTASGRHTYVLDYDLLDVFTPVPGRDEFVWELLDPGWPVPVVEAAVRIEGPAAFAAGCLAGASDQVTPCARRQAGPAAVEFHQSDLRPHEGVKIRAAFPEGVLDPAEPRYAPPHTAFTPWGWTALLLALPVALVARYRTPVWLRRTLLGLGTCTVLWDLLVETVPGGLGRIAVGDPLLGGLGLLLLGALAARPPTLRRG